MNRKNTVLENIAIYLLGIILLFFGLNGFFQFMSMPTPTGAVAVFFGGLAASVYFLPLLALTQVVIGILLVSKKWIPLALVMFAPISVNIMLYHLFIDFANIIPGLVVSILELYLIIVYFDSYKSLFE